MNDNSEITPAPPRAVVFDWDNTLVDTWPVIHFALTATFDAMGQTPWTFDETKSRVARSLRESFPGLFGNGWRDAEKVFLDTFAEVHLQRLTSLDNAEAVLRAVNREGIVCSIVSNKTGGFLRREVTHLGWDGYFHRVIGAKDAERDKPDPSPMLLALDGTSIPPGPDVWYVGDSPIDMAFATATGCRGVFVGSDEGVTKCDGNHPAHLVYPDLSCLLDIVETFAKRPS